MAMARLWEGIEPWSSSISQDPWYELMSLGWLAALVALRGIVMYVTGRAARRGGGGSLSHLQRELSYRPTVVPVTIHSLVTTLSAAAVIWPPGRPTLEQQPLSIWLWRRGVLPFSSAYWVFDLYFYCYQTHDLLIALHHLIILVIIYPIGDDAGFATLARMMPECNLVMMSTNGYIMELTTFLLYVRWFLTNLLRERGNHWVYTLNNSLLLATWVCLRLLYAPYFLVAHLWQLCPLADGGFFPLMGSITFVLMIAMSTVWLLQMLRNGVWDFLVLGQRGAALPKFGSQKPPGGAAAEYGYPPDARAHKDR